MCNNKFRIICNNLTLVSFLEKGSECLITQNCYEPVYNFATQNLVKFGVKVKFFENNNLKNFIKLITKKLKSFT